MLSPRRDFTCRYKFDLQTVCRQDMWQSQALCWFERSQVQHLDARDGEVRDLHTQHTLPQIACQATMQGRHTNSDSHRMDGTRLQWRHSTKYDKEVTS
jgi:hypothetical protein